MLEVLEVYLQSLSWCETDCDCCGQVLMFVICIEKKKKSNEIYEI